MFEVTGSCHFEFPTSLQRIGLSKSKTAHTHTHTNTNTNTNTNTHTHTHAENTVRYVSGAGCRRQESNHLFWAGETSSCEQIQKILQEVYLIRSTHDSKSKTAPQGTGCAEQQQDVPHQTEPTDTAAPPNLYKKRPKRC